MFQLTDPPGPVAPTLATGSLPSGIYDNPLSPGQILAGRFRIIRRIAVGGMGVVYEAVDEKLNRRVALKCARSGRGSLLSPEVRLATQVSHPNLCKIYEIHTADSQSGSIDFFTMEFLDGETLAARLQRGKLPEAEARDIAIQLCAGLAEAHRNKIVHGDLKSTNVILTKRADGTLRAVITDFGLARADGDFGFRGGTPAYMAPELKAGGAGSPLTDIYALGVILHELACGFRPDQRAALTSTSTMAGGETPRRRIAIFQRRPKHAAAGAGWHAVLKRSLHFDPRERYQTVEQVARALGPSILRRRMLSGVAALFLTALGAGAAWHVSTAPPESVHLAIDVTSAGPLAEDVFRQIGRLDGNERLGFTVTQGSHSAATHSFRITANPSASGTAIHVVLDDRKSQVPIAEWSMNYRSEDLPYAPVAIAGIVSGAFHLTPLNDNTISDEAERLWREAVALSRNDKRLDEAAALLQKAAVIDPGSALVHAALAEVDRRRWFITDDPAWKTRAADWARQAELRNSDCSAVHSIAGMLEADNSRREAAIARLQRAVELPLVNSDPWRRLAGVHRQNGQYRDAMQAYRRAIEIEPGFFLNHHELGTLQREMGAHEEAVASFGEAIRVAPAPVPQMHAARAYSYSDLGRFSDAENELRTLIQMAPDHPPYADLGQVLMYQRRLTEAEAWLKKAVEHDVKDYYGWMYLGLCQEWSGRKPEAQKSFAAAISLVGNEVRAYPRHGYARAVLAYLSARTGQAARAESEVMQAMQLTPSKSQTMWMAALTWETLGNRPQAFQILAAAPLTLLLDLQRWPEASKLTAEPEFLQLLDSARDKAARTLAAQLLGKRGTTDLGAQVP